MRRIPLILTTILLVLSFSLSIPQTHAVVLSAWGTATIDGVIYAAEWANADALAFSTGPGNIYVGTIYMMNDATNLYIGVTVNGDGTIGSNDNVVFYFDNDNGGEATLEVGDDFVLLSGPPIIFNDRFHPGTD